jgi:preprotein translocase subunit SecF
MKRVIHFSKYFIPAVIGSVVIITFGLIGYAFKGFNLGVDFQAGINQTVQMAIPVAKISYSGKGNAQLTVSDTALTLVVSGAEVEKKTVVIDYKTNPTIADLAKALTSQPDVQVALQPSSESAQSTLLVPTYQGNTLLSVSPVTLHRAPASAQEDFAPIEKVRSALASMGSVSVQVLSPSSLQRYLIRVQEKGNDPTFTETVRNKIQTNLESKFGPDTVVEVETNLVGAQYSQALSKQAFFLVIATLAVILLYCAIRFSIEYAIGAVLSVLHDALIMIAFIVWTRMEFNTSTIAAILTILGYSINDTIVQFDRVREERKLRPNDSFKSVLDVALSLTLGRTIITTLTTLLAVLALFFFTTGTMRDFSLALFIGMTSGVYSTIYVASAFVQWWTYMKNKRAKKAIQGMQKVDKPAKSIIKDVTKA